MLKVLHTADWHIGRRLYGQWRYVEFEAFLNWMITTVNEQAIEVLLISGDVFDTTSPGSRAQGLYYRFLARLQRTTVRHTVIIGGNHDSPTLLNAPAELLRYQNIHVIGRMLDDPADEVITLKDKHGTPELIVIATPYPRDQDVRQSVAGESLAEKAENRVKGIAARYKDATDHAMSLRDAMNKPVPMIAMGHLFAAGGRTIDGDGVRDLFVGSAAHVPTSVFPEALDYVALGHIHVPQILNKQDHIRYSGSPIPMGFGEAGQEKSVCVLSFDSESTKPDIELFPVPVFQKLIQLQGDLETLITSLKQLKEARDTAWIELTHTGQESVTALRRALEAIESNAEFKILRRTSTVINQQAQQAAHEGETLQDLTVNDVFNRLLEQRETPEEERESLRAAYHEIVSGLQEADVLDEDEGTP